MAIPVRLANGSTFYIEALSEAPESAPAEDRLAEDLSTEDLAPRGAAMSRRASAPVPVKEFREAAEVVEGIADELTERLARDRRRTRLAKLGLEVEVGFDAKGNVFIASGSASASLKLSLEWEIEKPSSEGG